VAAGKFREDLYFRLNVVSIQSRPLRERMEDIEVLAEHFLRRFAVENGMPLKRLATAARKQLRAYPWPGNIRELENAIERAILFSPGEVIQPAVLPRVAENIPAGAIPPMALPGSAAGWAVQHVSEDGRWLTAAELLRLHILRTLEHTGYNQSAAARLLGIDRHQLRRRMVEYGLATPGQAKRGRPAVAAPQLRRAA
jgi:DNA-binding NtrC family response regulator